MHTHGWIPVEELKNGYTQTDSMPTVKELRELAKSYGLRGYSTLRKPGLIRLIAEARAPAVLRERLKRALNTGRYPALRGDIVNPYKKLNAFVSNISLRMKPQQHCERKRTRTNVRATPSSDLKCITKHTSVL